MHIRFQSAKRSSPLAFTLVELLVVIGIVAIIAGGVMVAYDGVQSHAEAQLSLGRLQQVRRALLDFKRDMGFFPGEGPLAAVRLGLSGFKYLDGNSPDMENPSPEVREGWAEHPLNLWMLFVKPLDGSDPGRWTWRKEIARGWNGPYLGHGLGYRLDGAGPREANFIGNPRLNRLIAVADAFVKANDGPSLNLQWVQEDQELSSAVQPSKLARDSVGQPIAFLKDIITVPGFAIYLCVSAGPDGVFDFAGPDFGDDVRVEVARERL